MENRARIFLAWKFFGGVVLLGAISFLGFLLFKEFVLDTQTILSYLIAHSTSLTNYLAYKIENATPLNPYFYGGFLCLLIAERLMPAKKAQKMFSVGMLQDIAWFLANKVPLTFVDFFNAVILSFFYKEYLAFLTIDVTTWPQIYRLIMALLLGDFLGFFHHYVRHKVELFWYFHTIHHSQREMNPFADHRNHFLESMIAFMIAFIPSQMFQLDTISTGYFIVFMSWYTRFYHSNIRTNLGFLKHFLVTPQSHRIHHSIEDRHMDKNFSTLFTIWDRLFGTLYKNYDEYPDTGIAGYRFPLETSARGLSTLATYWAQTIYPFRLIRQRIGKVFYSERELAR